MGIQINGQTDTIKAIDGSLTMPGTVTYEDVSRVNVTGIVTAGQGLHVTGGSVGIGTDNPQNPLHLYGSSDILFKIESTDQYAHIDLGDNSSIARITNDGATGTLRLRADKDNAVGSSNIQFEIDGSEKLSITAAGQLQATGAADVRLTLGSSGTPGTNDSVHIRADGADLKFMAANGGTTIFERNGTETLRITSGGLVGIGTDNPDKKLTVFTDSNAGYSTATNSTPTGQSLIKLRNKNGTDGTGVNNYAAIEYSIANGATSQGWLGYTRTGDNAGAFFMKQRNGSSSYPETIRFPSSGGVTFGGGASDARTLDDYEEGVWTPSGATGATVTVARAYYIKIGRQVTVFFSAAITSGTGSAFTVNLPFAGTTSGFTGTSQGVEAHGNAMISNGNPPTNAYNANIYCWGATASVYFSIDGSNWVQAAGNEVGSSLQFTATYVVP